MSDSREKLTIERYLAEISAAVASRTTTYPTPSPNFDPRTATADQLARFGFPPRPDRKANPKVFEFWMRLFSPPLSYLAVERSFSLLQIDRAFDAFEGASPLPAYSTRHESSETWSGGYIAPRDGNMFTQLYGSWQVPTSTPPTGAGSDLSNYRCSVWIGLDGQRSYLNASLPQIGIVQYFDTSGGPPVEKASAWFQWWEPEAILPPISLPLVVKPGDLIACAMIVTDNENVKFLIKNQSTGVLLLPFDVQAPQATLENPTTVKQLTVSGATAEWILERPTEIVIVIVDGQPVFEAGRLRDLPNYGTEVFNNCLAIAAPGPGQAGRTETLLGARLIDMYEVDKGPNRTAFISRAQREAEETIATFYVG